MDRRLFNISCYNYEYWLMAIHKTVSKFSPKNNALPAALHERTIKLTYNYYISDITYIQKYYRKRRAVRTFRIIFIR